MYVLTVVHGSRSDILLRIGPCHEESPTRLAYDNLKTYHKTVMKKCSMKMFIQPFVGYNCQNAKRHNINDKCSFRVQP